MSRHGYVDDYDDRMLAMYRGQVASAIRGKRGQRLLRELRDALDAMPVKELVANSFRESDGAVCALGAVAAAKSLPTPDLEPYDEYEHEDMAVQWATSRLDIAAPLAREIMYENDEGGYRETVKQRWQRMRRWVESKIKEPKR